LCSEADGGALKTDDTTQTNPAGNGCVATNNGSTATEDATDLGFTLPLLPPCDFRLDAGSPLVKMVRPTCHRYRRQTRPTGGTRAFGADEYVP
jgi:hypothetical protein